MREQVDILVVGAGIAGLSAACLFAAAGLKVLCIDRAPSMPKEGAEGADLRTTAFLAPSVDLLDRAGVWPLLGDEIAPLAKMRIVDAGGRDGRARESVDFDAAEISDGPFGWNVANTAMRGALQSRISDLSTAELAMGEEIVDFVPRRESAIVRLGSGRSIEARLVVAADGRDSAMRDRLGIGVRRWGYAQKALVFSVSHPVKHAGVSTEIHKSGGPFTLVPMPDHQGRPRSSVVWMDRAGSAMRLAGLDQKPFEAEATRRSAGVLGPLRLISRRAVWPVISQVASKMHGPRTALIAEAAHVAPPIGAQGLNMSLADLRVLSDLVAEARELDADIGAPDLLGRYHRLRHPDVVRRVAGVDALNRASIAGAQPLKDLRRLGLKAIHDIPQIRKAAMRIGQG